MSEMISGVAGQLFRQILENQAGQQQPAGAGKRSFESYLPQNDPQQTQTQDTSKTGAVEQTKTGAVEPAPKTTTSGVEMQKKLDQMEAELSQRFKQTGDGQNKFNQMLPELLEGKSRLGFLRDAYNKMPQTSRVTNDLSGRFVQVETEYKQVEEIMRSDKNLSTGELLALQARLYQVSQHIEVMSKVVDQMAGGIKTILNTNV